MIINTHLIASVVVVVMVTSTNHNLIDNNITTTLPLSSQLPVTLIGCRSSTPSLDTSAPHHHLGARMMVSLVPPWCTNIATNSRYPKLLDNCASSSINKFSLIAKWCNTTHQHNKSRDIEHIHTHMHTRTWGSETRRTQTTTTTRQLASVGRCSRRRRLPACQHNEQAQIGKGCQVGT